MDIVYNVLKGPAVYHNKLKAPSAINRDFCIQH